MQTIGDATGLSTKSLLLVDLELLALLFVRLCPRLRGDVCNITVLFGQIIVAVPDLIQSS